MISEGSDPMHSADAEEILAKIAQSLSFDFRNPIATVKGWGELLGEGTEVDQEMIATASRSLQSCAKNLQAICDSWTDLLDAREKRRNQSKPE
jgi:hypothetical protein